MKIIDATESLLVRLAKRDDRTMHYSAADAEAVRFASAMLWVLTSPTSRTATLTENGRWRLLSRGLLPAVSRPRQQASLQQATPPMPLGGIQMWAIHGTPPGGGRVFQPR